MHFFEFIPTCISLCIQIYLLFLFYGFLVLIVFLYAISSFIGSHLLSKQCSVLLCVCLHFSNICNTWDNCNDEDCSLLGYYDNLTGNLSVHLKLPCTRVLCKAGNKLAINTATKITWKRQITNCHYFLKRLKPSTF